MSGVTFISADARGSVPLTTLFRAVMEMGTGHGSLLEKGAATPGQLSNEHLTTNK